jgi:hypothetical protein
VAPIPIRSITTSAYRTGSAASIKASTGSIDNYDSLGTIYGAVAAYEADHGGDPAPLVERSEHNLRAAAAIADDEGIHYNLGRLWTKHAHYLVNHGMNPHDAVDKAVAEFRVVAQMAANRSDAWAGTSDALIARVRYQAEHGEDVRRTAAQARESLERALTMEPEMIPPIKYRIMLAEVDAEARLAHGADPTSVVEHMRLDTQAVLNRLPADSWAYRFRCFAELIAARWALAHRQPVDSLLARAAIAAAHAREQDAMDAWAWTASAEVEGLRAEAALTRGLPSSAAVVSGRAFVDRALKIDPRLLRTLRIRDRLDRSARQDFHDSKPL